MSATKKTTPVLASIALICGVALVVAGAGFIISNVLTTTDTVDEKLPEGVTLSFATMEEADARYTEIQVFDMFDHGVHEWIESDNKGVLVYYGLGIELESIYYYENVRVKFSVSEDGVADGTIVNLWYFAAVSDDATDGQWFALPLTIENGEAIAYFGPAEGFIIDAEYSAITPIIVQYTETGSYDWELSVETV